MTTDSEKMKSRYKKYRKILKNLTIMSDVFMRNVLKDRKCTEYILQVIMEKKNLKIVDQVLQKDYKNLQGRSAILDCVVQDADGKQFDVEIQQEKEGASPRRARYHSGLLDMNTLDPGQEFDRLPDTYVIFITWTDTLGRGLPIYHIGRTIEETGECFRDGSTYNRRSFALFILQNLLGKILKRVASAVLCTVNKVKKAVRHLFQPQVFADARLPG